MKCITLSEIVIQARKKARNKTTVNNRKYLHFVARCCKDWGEHVAIYEDQQTRYLTAEALAHRLGLSPEAVKQSMDTMHRRNHYDEERRDSSLEG